jgi:dihydrodipicolinate synthase/N-acetylneuraminate lyase
MSLKQTKAMCGVFPILQIPFDAQSRIDDDDLRSVVEFSITTGAHGLGVALASEVFKLSEAERDHVTRIVVEQTRGRVPVVINTGAAGTDLAVLYSQHAEQNGADAVMVIPPTFMPASADEVREYYRAISDAVGIPIFIQDTGSAPVSAGLARQIAAECENVRYIKVESTPPPLKVAEMVSQAGEQLTVFGGAGGSYFIEEMRRGSLGTMPFCSQVDAFAEIWNQYRTGNEPAARQVFDKFIEPINRITGQGNAIFFYVHKEILRHRGVIKSSRVRSPAPPVEEQTKRELQTLLDELYPQ